MKIPKAVIDTNVFVSASILKGTSSSLMELWKENKFILLFSPDIFDEYFEVIARPKFKQEEKDIREFAELLTQKGISVEPCNPLNVVKKDPSDNKFLECAVEGKADVVISGDKHLLELKKYKTIQIITLSVFLSSIK